MRGPWTHRDHDVGMSESTLREPWFRPDAALSDRLLAEARREIGPGHELEGVELVACVARCSGCDDTVIRCADDSYTVIHLTWQANELPPWPTCTRIGSFIGLELVMDQHEH